MEEQDECNTDIQQELLNNYDKFKIKANCCVILCEFILGIFCFCKY